MALITSNLTRGWASGRADKRVRRPRTPLLERVARRAARVLPTVAAARTILLSLAGFGLLTAAAWSLATWAGLATAGTSLLIIEYLTADQ